MAPQIFHASTVSIDGRAAVITGASGSGKSALALQLIALGAQLISDDRTELSVSKGTLFASRPPTLPKCIEARGVGLIDTPMVPRGQVALVVDMDNCSTERMPEPKVVKLLGIQIPTWCNVKAAHFPAAIFVHLSNWRTPQ